MSVMFQTRAPLVIRHPEVGEVDAVCPACELVYTRLCVGSACSSQPTCITPEAHA